MSYIVFVFLIRTYILYSQLARCCIRFLPFFVSFFDVGCSDFLFSCSRKTNPISFSVYNLLYYNTCVIFFKENQKLVFNKINLSIDMLIIFYVRTYSIVLSICIFCFTGTVFSGFSRRTTTTEMKKENFSRFDVVIMNCLFFSCFFLCNFCFWFSVCLFRARLYCCLSTRRKKKYGNED